MNKLRVCLFAIRRHAMIAMMLTVTTGALRADLNVTRNGVTWPETFEGSNLPEFSEPVWAAFDENGFAARSSDGDIYSIVSGSVGVASSYEISSAGWNNGSAARTLEFRARVPDAEFLAIDGAASVILGLNGTAYDLRLYPDKIAYNGTDGVLSPANQVLLDMTEFHTFRIVIDQNAANAFTLYVDNNPVPALEKSSFWFTSPGFDKVVFGDISTGGQSGKSDWDFISWNPNGAFRFALTGDYSANGAVDAADYTVWRDSLGSTTDLRADGDGNGTIGSGDYTVWTNSFVGGAAVVTAAVVPEPTTMLLSAMGLLAICVRRGIGE